MSFLHAHAVCVRSISLALLALLFPYVTHSFSLGPNLSVRIAHLKLAQKGAAFSTAYNARPNSQSLSFRTRVKPLQLAAKIAPPKKLEFLERKKLQEAIKRMHPVFEDVRSQEFFRYYAVDLLSSCTFFPTADAPCDMDR